MPTLQTLLDQLAENIATEESYYQQLQIARRATIETISEIQKLEEQ